MRLDALDGVPGEEFDPRRRRAFIPPPRPANQTDAPVVALKGTVLALRQGLDRGEIVIRYQPVVRLSDRRVVMLEALARWDRGGSGFTPLAANDFVPLAESNGLARELAQAVVARAAAEFRAATTSASVPNDLALSVNLPLAVLQEPTLLPWLHRAVGAAGLAPRRLMLELTETQTVRDHGWLRRALRRLRGAGYQVLLDDLALDDDRRWLLALPFSGIKIDLGLVARLPRSARARFQLRAIVAEAHARGMTVTAEGVEDATLWRILVGLGVDHAQGFAVGRPLAPGALRAWSSEWRARGHQPAP